VNNSHKETVHIFGYVNMLYSS